MQEFRVGVTGAGQSSDGVWDVLGHVTYRDCGSIKLGNGGVLPSDDEITSTLFKVTARPSDALELYASYARYQGVSSDPQNPQGANVAGPGNDLVFRDARNNTAQMGLAFDPAGDLINLNLVGYCSKNSVEEDEVDNAGVSQPGANYKATLSWSKGF